MQIIYNNSSKCNGVYFIKNITNDRLYVGSTVRFSKRFKSHISSLKAGTHSNKFLQHDWNKCGEDSFIFEVIEVTEEKLVREQYYLDKYYDNQKYCYNLRSDACDSRVGAKNNKPNSITDKRCKSPSEEVKKKRVDAIKQTYKEDDELRAKAALIAKENRWKDHSTNIVLVNKETKEEVLVTGSLREFAIERGISYKSLHLVVRGKGKSCGGWYVKDHGEPVYVSQSGQVRKPLSDEHKRKIANSKYKGIELINVVTGKVLCVGDSVKEFANQNGLYYTTLIKVLNKQCKSISQFKLKIEILNTVGAI